MADIASERDALAQLVTVENPDRSDPRWARLVELHRRESELREMSRSAIRRPTPAGVMAAQAASRIANLGQLADATPDTMTLHTKMRIACSPAAADTEGGLPAIPGGKRFAAVLKSIWHLSANDNPYADWLLVRMYDALAAIRAHLSRVITAREEAIDLLKRKGFTLSVMSSRSPKTVELGFRSPYGYATAEAIVEFDYYVADDQDAHPQGSHERRGGRIAIRGAGGNARLVPRSDPLGAAPPARGTAAIEPQRLPAGSRQIARRRGVPRSPVWRSATQGATGMEAPRHTRRRVKLTDAELHLLEQASLTAAEDSRQTDTELL
jgi:hypothetical protein